MICKFLIFIVLITFNIVFVIFNSKDIISFYPNNQLCKILCFLVVVALTILLINLIIFDIVYIILEEVLFASILWHIYLLFILLYCIILNHVDVINTTKLIHFLLFPISLLCLFSTVVRSILHKKFW